MHGHHSTFYLGTDVTLFLQSITISTPLGLAIAFVVYVLLGTLYEGVKCLRAILAMKAKLEQRRKKFSLLSRPHVAQSALFMVEFLFGYAIMLTVMTYNAWLFLAAILGSACGYLFCKMVIDKHKKKYEAAAAANIRELKPLGDKQKETGGVTPASGNLDASSVGLLDQLRPTTSRLATSPKSEQAMCRLTSL